MNIFQSFNKYANTLTNLPTDIALVFFNNGNNQHQDTDFIVNNNQRNNDLILLFTGMLLELFGFIVNGACENILLQIY